LFSGDENSDYLCFSWLFLAQALTPGQEKARKSRKGFLSDKVFAFLIPYWTPHR
jgi:hypothetical protein